MEGPPAALTERQAQYWREQDTTVSAMLGGYGDINDIDTAGSRSFIKSIWPTPSDRQGRVLDLGAGVGRVACGVLQPLGFPTIDLQGTIATVNTCACAYLCPHMKPFVSSAL